MVPSSGFQVYTRLMVVGQGVSVSFLAPFDENCVTG